MESGAGEFELIQEILVLKSNIKRVIDAAKSNNSDPYRCQFRLYKKNILAKYGHPTPEAMVESALENIDFFLKNRVFIILKFHKIFICT